MLEVAKQRLGLSTKSHPDEPMQVEATQSNDAKEVVPESANQGEELMTALKPDEPEQVENLTAILEDSMYNTIFRLFRMTIFSISRFQFLG